MKGHKAFWALLLLTLPMQASAATIKQKCTLKNVSFNEGIQWIQFADVSIEIYDDGHFTAKANYSLSDFGQVRPYLIRELRGSWAPYAQGGDSTIELWSTHEESRLIGHESEPAQTSSDTPRTLGLLFKVHNGDNTTYTLARPPGLEMGVQTKDGPKITGSCQ